MMRWDDLPEWKRIELSELTAEERANLRSHGDMFPDPPSPPPPAKPRENLDGSFACPDCGCPLEETVSRLGGRYIQVPSDWTDDEIRWAAAQIRARRIQIRTDTLRHCDMPAGLEDEHPTPTPLQYGRIP